MGDLPIIVTHSFTSLMLFMHLHTFESPAVRIVVVPVGVTVLLGLRNPPRSCTDTVGPSLPGFTIAPCVDSLLCYRLIRLSLSLRQSQNLRYVYAFIQLYLSCPTRL
jgi:hypothetical protein